MGRRKLELDLENARCDYRRLNYLYAEVYRRDPDHVVAIAMMHPVVAAAKKALDSATKALEASRAGFHTTDEQTPE
ncbi:MAG: hypothetical protein H7332_16650 [Bdellovibrionales bacterium]|nr:hypothetical protein [Ramlibacter sp.]